MKFNLVARKNPQDRKLDPKYYAQPEYNGTVDIDFIARQIAGRSSLTVGDIKNVLFNFHTPDSALKSRITDSISYEHSKSVAKSNNGESEGDDRPDEI